MNEKLQEAVSLYKKGEKVQASRLLAEIVRQEPSNAVAWYGLALCLDDLEKKIYCLKRVLSIDSSHKKAQQLLEKLQGTQQQPESQELVGQPKLPQAQIKSWSDWLIISIVGIVAVILFCGVMGRTLSSRVNIFQPATTPVPPTRIPTTTDVDNYIVGTWLDNWIVPCTITIKKINGSYQMTRLYDDGSRETKFLTAQTVDGIEILIEYPNSPTGDYMMILENGNLAFFDNEGFIYEDYPE